MIIDKEKLIKYFNHNKWETESFEESFLNDFNNSNLIKNLEFENINDDVVYNNKFNKIEFYYKELKIKDENNLIFIPLFQFNGQIIGIGYLFSNQSLNIIDKFELKTFCKFIINQKELDQMILI